MSEMNNDFEQMLDESFKTIRNGEVLEGKVISVKPEEAVLNIGYKADGILPVNEYSNTAEDLTTEISVGDELTVKVLKVNDGEGQVALSYKRLAAEKANKRLEEAFENNEVLKAPVVQILKGGLGIFIETEKCQFPPLAFQPLCFPICDHTAVTSLENPVFIVSWPVHLSRMPPLSFSASKIFLL